MDAAGRTDLMPRIPFALAVLAVLVTLPLFASGCFNPRSVDRDGGMRVDADGTGGIMGPGDGVGGSPGGDDATGGGGDAEPGDDSAGGGGAQGGGTGGAGGTGAGPTGGAPETGGGGAGGVGGGPWTGGASGTGGAAVGGRGGTGSGGAPGGSGGGSGDTGDIVRMMALCRDGAAAAFAADLNGDGRRDILCRTSTAVAVELTGPSGNPTGQPSWSQNTSWCTKAGEVVHLGDFNGDGRADLLCKSATHIMIDYAASGGQVGIETNWMLASTYCTHAGSSLGLGDFNGDGRTDLLCRDSKMVWIDYADANGQFIGEQADWRIDDTLCAQSGSVLTYADFNGDRRTDRLCRSATQMWMDFADASGRFGGFDWQRATTWCAQGGTLLIGDFNRDQRADLACADSANLTIDHTDESGASGTIDWTSDRRWCAVATHQKLVADFDGDGRSDLLCRESTTFRVNHAMADGRFMLLNW